MKKIHKKIIALQARAIDKALKQVNFKEQRMGSARGPGYDRGYKDILMINNTVFSHGVNKLRSSSALSKARFVRSFFKSDEFDFYKNSEHGFRAKCGRNWNLSHHVFTYSFKTIILFEMIGFKDDTSFSKSNLVKMVYRWLRDDRTTKFAPMTWRFQAIQEKHEGGIKPDETIVLGHTA